MKKIQFYSLMKKDNTTTAVLHNGYTDGVYNYYKSDYCGIWYAILPVNGIAFAQGYTRKEAAANAHAPETKKKLTAYLSTNNNGPALAVKFDNAIAAAGV